MNRKFCLFTIIFLYAGICQSVFGASQQIPLDKFSAMQTLTLNCVSDEQAVDIPISDRWEVKKLVVTLHYISSNNLSGELSQLTVKINNLPIAQTKLNPASPDVIVKINMPVQYLEAGYNHLSFAVTQHLPENGKSCEKACSPDQWTIINLKDSLLEIEYEEKPVPLMLSGIADMLFDPKVFPDAHVNLIVENESAQSLTALGITASGIARRYDYRKVSFEVSKDVVPGIENVLVGRSAFVSAFLNTKNLALGQVKGGYLKIFHLPFEAGKIDPNHALLVLTGDQYDQVKLAAEAFANISFGFPGSQEMSAFSFRMPEILAYGGREVVHANKTYSLKTLNFPTITFKGINPVGKTINFRLPSDFLIRENLSAKLSLHFAYGAGLHPTSALNINVNGKTVRAIHIANPDGSFFDNYIIEIPTYLFKPGSNVIAFDVQMHPPYQECDLALMGNMFLTVFDNSTLTFPDMPHFVEMPKLELFMLNGFPFTRWPDGFESRLYLPEIDKNSLAAAMNLIGLITQKNGHPLLEMKIETTHPKKIGGDIIIVGSIGKIPADLLEKSPLGFGATSEIPYPVVREWDDQYSLAYIQQRSELGADRGLLAEFESPYATGSSVLIVSAENGKSLLTLSQILLDPETQAQSTGGVTLIDMGSQHAKPKVFSFNAGKTYTTGKAGKVSMLESYLYSHASVYYALIIALTLGFSYALWFSLARYRSSRKLGRTTSENKH